MEKRIKHLTEADIVLSKNTIKKFHKFVCRDIPTYEGRMPSIVVSHPEHDGTIYMDDILSAEEFDFIRENVYEENASMTEEEAFLSVGIRFVYDDGENVYYFK